MIQNLNVPDNAGDHELLCELERSETELVRPHIGALLERGCAMGKDGAPTGGL